MILVCGSTGTIGSQVIQALSKAAVPVRALAREPGQTTPRQDQAQVQYVVGDLAKPETLKAALDGVTEAFLLSPIGSNQYELEANFAEAAAAAKGKRIVKLSVLGAAPDAPFEFGRIHGRVEAKIQESGLAWTFLRANMLMQNLRWYKSALSQGALPLPLGGAAVSHIDAGDIGAVAAQVLMDNRHSMKTYALTGPESLTGEQAAAILSSAFGKTIEYRPASMTDFRNFLKGSESEFVVNAECELFDLWSEGMGKNVTSCIKETTGREATTLKEFAERNRKQLLES